MTTEKHVIGGVLSYCLFAQPQHPPGVTIYERIVFQSIFDLILFTQHEIISAHLGELIDSWH